MTANEKNIYMTVESSSWKPASRLATRSLIVVLLFSCNHLFAGTPTEEKGVQWKEKEFFQQGIEHSTYIYRSQPGRKKKVSDGSLCLHASQVLYQHHIVTDYIVAIKAGMITGVFPSSSPASRRCKQTEHYEGLLAPGLIDIHIHGAGGMDVMDALTDPTALTVISRQLLKEGVTSWLPTTTSAPHYELSSILFNITQHARRQPFDEASIAGIHMEGPFISPHKKGCHGEDTLQPISLRNLVKWKSISGELLKIITYAPELEQGNQLVSWCINNNVLASIGHSAATEEQTLAAIVQGAHMGTHMYNAMSMPRSRDAGVALSILSGSNIPFEIITDGFHLSKEMMRLAWKLTRDKPERFIVISDAMRAKGLESQDSSFVLGKDIRVIIRNGQAIQEDTANNANPTLAGSITTIPNAVKVIRNITQCSTADALLTASHNPATALGLTTKGLISPGYEADFVLFSDEASLSVIGTWRKGKQVFPLTDPQ